MNDDPTPTPADRAIDWNDVLRVCAAAREPPWRAEHFGHPIPTGVWFVEYGPEGDKSECFDLMEDPSEGTVRFIALARTALPAAARLILDLRAENERLRELCANEYDGA